MIGDDVEIVILGKEGDTVKIGIKAPREVSVNRKEIYEEILAANQSALQAPGWADLQRMISSKKQEIDRKESEFDR
jgi:carbon storage regulator